MDRGRRVAVVASATAALAAGCGLGPGERSGGEATLTVTRDYGSERLLAASVEDPAESDTVLRVLEREADTATRYGGGFVHSIDGLAGGVEEGRSLDWFFFVNGVESDRGAVEVEVRGGDRIWWDRRDWTNALRTPAVVGSWPEPFAQGSSPDPLAVAVECRGSPSPCEEAAERLAEAGVETRLAEDREQVPESERAPRVLVGPFARLRSDPAATMLERPPSTSGVFARFERSGAGYRLLALDERGVPERREELAAGLIAAVREGEEPPTWLVTGTDRRGVELASEALGPGLADRYALFVSRRGELALPAGADGR